MTIQEAYKVKIGDELNYLGRIVTVEGIKLEDRNPTARIPIFTTDIGDISHKLLKRAA